MLYKEGLNRGVELYTTIYNYMQLYTTIHNYTQEILKKKEAKIKGLKCYFYCFWLINALYWVKILHIHTKCVIVMQFIHNCVVFVRKHIN